MGISEVLTSLVICLAMAVLLKLIIEPEKLKPIAIGLSFAIGLISRPSSPSGRAHLVELRDVRLHLRRQTRQV